MKALTRVWWGADPVILLNVYRGMVRSHLEYACQAIFSTSQLNRNKINRIQSQALRFVTVCMRSTSTNVLLAECAEMPMNLRWDWICAKYALKHLSREHSLARQRMLQFYGLYNRNPVYWCVSWILGLQGNSWVHSSCAWILSGVNFTILLFCGKSFQ